MNKRIIACDLDGTLLGSDGEVSAENWKAIAEMTEKGHYFVPASGRCFMELPAEIRECKWIRYYILSGGAVIYDKKEDRFEMTCPEQGVKDRVLDAIFRHPVCLMAHIGRESCVDVNLHNGEDYASFGMNEYWIRYALEKESPREDFKSFVYGLEQIPMMVVFFRNPEDLEACRAILNEETEVLVVQSDPNNLEIVSKNAGKGNALLNLAASLGVPVDGTIAVGDSQNDRTMLELAGLSLAMENAVPEMKAISDVVICDNDSHCAKYVLERYLS